MASCYHCIHYDGRYGPIGTSHCKAWNASFTDDNPDVERSDPDRIRRLQEFRRYYDMGGSATNSCPHGNESSRW